jgi:hypothetical protein
VVGVEHLYRRMPSQNFLPSITSTPHYVKHTLLG